MTGQHLPHQLQQQQQQQPSSRVAAALASSRRGPPAAVNLGVATSAMSNRQEARAYGNGPHPNNHGRGLANGPSGVSNNAAGGQPRTASPVKDRTMVSSDGAAKASPPPFVTSFAFNQSRQPAPAGNSQGMRPLQLRSNPYQQQQPSPQSMGYANSQPIQMPRPAIHPSQQKPRVPMLQVTVPDNRGNSPYNTTGGGGAIRPPTSPLARGAAPASPRAVFAQPPLSPSGFSSSSETLVGSAEKEGKAWSPSSSTSHGNLHLKVKTDDLIADPENDRLMPATPSRAGRQDFWKRFSTVVHENERKEAMSDKVYGKKAGQGARSKSEWLEKQVGGQRNFRLWVGFLAFLILAAIGGGLAYHFVSKNGSTDTSTQPSTHDFGLGTDTNSTSQTAKDGIIASSKDAGGNDLTLDTSSELPAPSSVAAGQTLRVRSFEESLSVSVAAFQTALPVFDGHVVLNKRESLMAAASPIQETRVKGHPALRRAISKKHNLA